MYKSKTFSDDLNINNHKRSHINKIVSISVLCCIEILTSSTLYGYSVILWKNSQSYHTQDKSFSYENGLWAVVVYLFSYGIADPWCKYLSESLEDNSRNLKLFRTIIFGATIMLVTNFYIFVLFEEEYYLYYNVIYGLICGISTNIITSFIIGKVMEQYDVDTRNIEIFTQISKSISLLLMPNVVLYFSTFFNNTSGIYFVYGSLLILILPFTLFIRNNSKYVDIVKSQDSILQKNKDIPLKNVSQTINAINEAPIESSYSSLSSDDYVIQEIHDDSVENENAVNYWETTTTTKNYYKVDDGDDFDHFLTVAQLPQGNEVTEYAYKVPSMFVKNYYESAGVSILPSIPEEEESEDINLISLKRLSRISTVLEELNENQKILKFPSTDSLLFSSLHSLNNCDNITECENNENSITTELENQTEEDKISFSNRNELLDKKSVLKQMKRKKSSCCSPYKKYKYRLKCRRFKYFLLDYFIKPFYISAKNIYFYPPLLTKSLNNLISTLLFTSIPFIVTNTSRLPVYETTMLLSMIALSWSFSLTSVPIMKDCSITKMRALFISGLIMCGIALSLIHMKTMKISNDCFIIGSCMYGFGVGIINCWENVIYRRFIGIHKWNRVKGCLETMSALLNIIIYSIIYYFRMENKLPMFISIASGTYFMIAILWIVSSIVVKCLKFAKHCCTKETNYLNDYS